ncbi:uncharacterized protein LOC100825226 isoform X8 [Brachypodium distachyon]|uniref:Uncharacterized protein n=1 Tax=Brachypodium distachyon TaxID=15368 RepID=I1I9X1_BRADI|nr:uncharacterized protein LOC100825226 isoform X8 [Brachypodium distachyon]KQJ99579.1 hypothetical protein BRADI_3g44030v3 [Brachypodium distachyon]|eukprot:XP_024317260.1 uncharacterized protein LOC100825226 isoform X8 [Brachypodium distachyon]
MTMACRALALQLQQFLPCPTPSYYLRAAAASVPRVSTRRRLVSSVRCCGAGDQEEPPQDSVLKATPQVASSHGRVPLTTDFITGSTVTDDATNEWLVLDKKVNTYPTVREFTAIGIGGDDFVHSMVIAVESVLQESIPKGQMSQKVSSKGKYTSVKIGPLSVVSSEQVQAIYIAMKKDDRIKFFL